MRLGHIRIAIQDNSYKRVLRTIGLGIAEAENAISKASEYDVPEHTDSVVDSECDLVENLLGAAFVVCQTQINTVANRALPFLGETKDSKPYEIYNSHTNSICALANYFKHRDEWSIEDWNAPSGRNIHTIKAIVNIGLRYGSTGNLRTGSEWLGNSDYTQTNIFSHLIDRWSDEVLSNCVSVLKSKENYEQA